MMIRSQSCSWCHTMVVIDGARVLCPVCGHRADVARLQCDCAACRRQGIAPRGVRYTGIRTRNGCQVHRDEWDGSSTLLNPRNDLFNHSPDGFEWGYRGSGPAQLGLALLADVLGDDQRAIRLHQDFKERFVATFHHHGWMMRADQIQEWADRQDREADTDAT